MLIGLAGNARAGKDTVGGILVNDHRFQQRAFADLMRAAAMAIDPILGYDRHKDLLFRYSDLITAVGYERAKDVEEMRRFLQRLGTDMGRKLFGENFWVDTAFSTWDVSRPTVITDVRFPNEAQAVKDRDGIVVLIERPGCKPANDHISEHALAGWDYDHRLDNDGSLVELQSRVEALVS